jgi:hypothetical protein
MSDHPPQPAFPATLEHKHGLSEWWPMLPERTAETVQPGEPADERFYRCQKVGCSEMVRIGANDLTDAGHATA